MLLNRKTALKNQSGFLNKTVSFSGKKVGLSNKLFVYPDYMLRKIVFHQVFYIQLG